MREEEPLWAVYPKVDSFVEPPGKEIKVGLTVQNLSDSALYFSKAEIAPSWANGKRGIKPTERSDYLASGNSAFLTEFNLRLPSTPSLYTIKFGLETWVYNNYTTDWRNLGILWTSDWGYIQVTPQPIYTVFVSCSLREEDKPVVNQILNMLKLWGVEPRTVGITRFSEDPLRVPEDIDNEIEKSEAVIGIATPRDYSAQDKIYRHRTFPWLHIETKKAIDSDKPLLFIVDERIRLEGLLEYPDFPKVLYHPTKLDVLEHRLAVVMPGFREWIAKKNKKERGKFDDGLVKAGLILGGIWLVGKLMEEGK
ncbi:MAG: hypothetical protein QME81_05270 [bacterium]|nr:hypothetical protein [bacterium]